jgi:ribosomal protein RSM22 (predicted rRNA methylase)
VFYFRILEIFNFRKRIIIETFSFFFIQKSSEKESTDLRSPSPSAKRSLDEAEQPVEKKLKTCEENVAEVGAASEPAAQGKFIIKGVLSTGRVRLDLLSRSVRLTWTIVSVTFFLDSNFYSFSTFTNNVGNI